MLSERLSYIGESQIRTIRAQLNELIDQSLCGLNNVLLGIPSRNEFFGGTLYFKKSKRLAIAALDLRFFAMIHSGDRFSACSPGSIASSSVS
jgi:hypothetical protein